MYEAIQNDKGFWDVLYITKYSRRVAVSDLESFEEAQSYIDELSEFDRRSARDYDIALKETKVYWD